MNRPSLTQILVGTRHAQEYLCVSPFAGAVASIDAAGVPVDVTHRHVFLGYLPTLVALPCRADEVLLTVSDGPMAGDAEWRGHVTERAATGRVLLQCRRELPWGGLYEGVDGQEFTLGVRGRIAHRVLAARHPPSVGNSAIDPAAALRMRVLYTLARPVDLVTVGTASGFNRFPVDLHGVVGSHAVFSLRKGASSAEQVERAGRLVLAAMPIGHAAAVYAQGPNHMRESVPLDAGGREVGGTPGIAKAAGPFAGLPVPGHALGWWLVEGIEAIFAAGEHQIFLGTVAESEPPAPTAPRLHHVHRDAVVRRDRQGLQTPCIVR